MTLVQTEPKSIKIGSTAVKKVMLGSTQIRPVGWTPGANTLLYYDFEHTSGTTETDLAGNYNGTYQNGSPSIGTLSSGKKYFNTQGTNCLNTNSTLSTLNYNNAIVCVWFNMQVANKSFFGQERWGVQGGTIFCENYNGNNQFCLGLDSNNISTALSIGTWYNIIIVNDGTKTTLYVNGQQVTQKNMTSSTGNKYFHVGGAANYSSVSPQTVSSNNIGNAFFGSVIIENKARTAQEVSDYYNQTKGNYGIQALNNNLNNTFTPTITPATPNSGTGDILTI